MKEPGRRMWFLPSSMTGILAYEYESVMPENLRQAGYLEGIFFTSTELAEYVEEGERVAEERGWNGARAATIGNGECLWWTIEEWRGYEQKEKLK